MNELTDPAVNTDPVDIVDSTNLADAFIGNVAKGATIALGAVLLRGAVSKAPGAYRRLRGDDGGSMYNEEYVVPHGVEPLLQTILKEDGPLGAEYAINQVTPYFVKQATLQTSGDRVRARTLASALASSYVINFMERQVADRETRDRRNREIVQRAEARDAREEAQKQRDHVRDMQIEELRLQIASIGKTDEIPTSDAKIGGDRDEVAVLEDKVTLAIREGFLQLSKDLGTIPKS